MDFAWTFTLCFVWNILSPCDASERVSQFKLRPGERIASGAKVIRQIASGAMSSVKCAAFCGSDCGMFHFSAVNKICTVFEERYSDSGVVSAKDSDWTIGQRKIIDRVKRGDWTLVFRAQSGIGVKVYDTWVKTGIHHDNPVAGDFPAACLRMSDYGSCDRHFRSDILDNWHDIEEVYMAWVKDNVEVAFIRFNGINSNRDSWFSPSRIRQSTWSPSIITDKPLLNMASINGFCPSVQCRRFYLSGPHSHCETEWSYSYTIDVYPDWCDSHGYWEPNFIDSIPTFMYSATNGRAAIGINRGYPLHKKADVLAIWVKLDR